MATLTVRKLDEDIVRRLRIRAAEHGRSAEAEHREILRASLGDKDVVSEAERVRRMDAAAQARAFRNSIAGRGIASVSELLHETRTARMEQLAPYAMSLPDKPSD